jgi:hypothetical protein
LLQPFPFTCRLKLASALPNAVYSFVIRLLSYNSFHVQPRNSNVKGKSHLLINEIILNSQLQKKNPSAHIIIKNVTQFMERMYAPSTRTTSTFSAIACLFTENPTNKQKIPRTSQHIVTYKSCQIYNYEKLFI